MTYDKRAPEEAMTDPAQPVEATSRTCKHDKRFGGVFGLPREDNGCLACALERTMLQLSLAQTENAGHIRIEDELKAELREATDEMFRVAELNAKNVGELKRAEARCVDAEKDRDSWKREAEMIGNAWQRELCEQGILYRHKTYWIDFMVLATRKVMDLAKENGVICCDQPELCAKMDCNKLLRFRLDATLSATKP